QPELLRMSLGDEDAWELGLTCGGTVEVLVQRVDASSPSDPTAIAYAEARRAYEAGRSSMVIARLDERPERLVIDDAGATTGTLGDALLDARALDIGRERLASARQSGVERIESDGAAIMLFFERIAPPECVVIYGASQVAM